MLRWRIILGALLITSLTGLLILDYRSTTPGGWLLVAAVVVGLAGAQEVISLLSASGQRPRADVIYAGTLAVILSNAIPLWWRPEPPEFALARLAWPLIAFTLCLLVVLVGEMRRYTKPGGVIVHVALALFGIAYIGLTLSFGLQMRLLSGNIEGLLAVAALVIVVKLGDIGAYTVGRMFGRHKMAPVLSPGKTLEGAGGAIVFATLGAWLAMVLLPRALEVTLPQRSWSWLLFGVVVGLAGLTGDLAESLFKRDMGRKDSSTWLPGFGGVLDVLDSILFAAPVAYLCWWLCGV